jgi:hypothetical protein
MNQYDNIGTAIARLRTVWMDRGRLVWLPWPVAGLVLFAVARDFFVWLQS